MQKLDSPQELPGVLFCTSPLLPMLYMISGSFVQFLTTMSANTCRFPHWNATSL